MQLHVVMRAGPELPVLDHWKIETTPRARSRSDTPRSTANSTVISGLSSGPSSQSLIRRCLPRAALESSSLVRRLSRRWRERVEAKSQSTQCLVKAPRVEADALAAAEGPPPGSTGRRWISQSSTFGCSALLEWVYFRSAVAAARPQHRGKHLGRLLFENLVWNALVAQRIQSEHALRQNAVRPRANAKATRSFSHDFNGRST